jgi:hypothetical protein
MRDGGRPDVAKAVMCAAVALFAVAGGVHAQGTRPRQLAQTQTGVGDRDVTILNRSGHAVSQVYVSPSSAQQWGDDRLGKDALPPGKSTHVRIGRARDCEYDVQVIYDNVTREESRDVNLCRVHQVTFDGSSAVAIEAGAGENGHPLTLTNHAGRPIQQVFLSQTDSDQWGDDRLGDDSLSVGDSKTITYPDGCKADLRIVYDNRSAEERRGVDLCATPRLSIEPGWTTADTPPSGAGTQAPTTAAAAPLSAAPPAGAEVSVVNRSGHDIAEFYLAPEGGDRGPDRLGANLLKDGAAATMRLDPSAPCKFTAHVVFSGHEQDRDVAGLDLCANPRIELSPADAAAR